MTERPLALAMSARKVVALRRRSAPEVVIDGCTGVLVDNPADLSPAIDQARRLDPGNCRRHVAAQFCPTVMAARYEAAYHRALAPGATKPGRRSQTAVFLASPDRK
jgi:hypothetical protein